MLIKISPVDKLFSQFIRSRDKWRCQYPTCGKFYPPPTTSLHCAHIFTRGRKSTRFDPHNAVALCYGHHAYLDANPLQKYDFYIKKFGQEQFDALRMRASMTAKIDVEVIKLWLKEELKKFGTPDTFDYDQTPQRFLPGI